MAKHFGIKNPNPIFEKVQEAISQFDLLAKNNGISTDSTKLINSNLKL